MALNNLQERVEKSIFEAIRLVTVQEGYFPDEAAFINLPNGQSAFEAAILAIINSKRFAVETFGASSSQAKGQKRTPRITQVTRRNIMGDLGSSDSPIIQNDPDQPEQYITGTGTAKSHYIQIDILTTASTAAQDRILGAIVTKALGVLNYINFFDDPSSQFLVRQFSYYDLPEVAEGIIEKTFCYEIPDLYLEDDKLDTVPASLIKQIDVALPMLTAGAIQTPNGIINGNAVDESSLHVD